MTASSTARERIARVGDAHVVWDAADRRLSIYVGKGSVWNSPIVRPLYSFGGRAAESFAAAVVVTHMRGGAEAVAELVRSIFDLRAGSAIAAGMFHAEVRSYRRVNGMIVRDMES